MDWVEVGQIATAVMLSALSGGGIILGCSKWIGELFANRYVEKVKHELQQEIESYRTKLKKSEFLFQKEFEAASEFSHLRLRLEPRIQHPDEDWDEALDRFGQDLERVEGEITRYLAAHGAALQEPVLAMVRKVLIEAEHGKFEYYPFGPAQSIAKRVLDLMERIETELRSAVWSQSST